jgi:hypothetical protein
MKKISILFLLYLIVFGGCLFSYQALLNDAHVIARLTCGSDRVIELYKRRPWLDVDRFLYYRVLVNGVTRVDYVAGGEHDRARGSPPRHEDRRYRSVKSQNGQIVAVHTTEFPYCLIVLHDFSTGESWPRDGRKYAGTGDGSLGTYEDGMRRRQLLREKLEIDHPEISLTAKAQDGGYLGDKVTVNFSFSRVSDMHLRTIENLEHLEHLNLSYTLTTDEGLHRLMALPMMRILNLSGSRVTDKGMEQLVRRKDLTQLEVADTVVTNVGLRHLERLKELEFLDVRRTQVTETGVDALQRALPKMRVIYDNMMPEKAR